MSDTKWIALVWVITIAVWWFE
ncbi:Protein of unknown function [Bacillus cytotoxicus]|uniref:Uncharacterized protein n=1 Tax=Bacillus cytotoxicus TaxID=580165 RepID=A0AAX2CNN2_9BACI|nr:Protein of unknown function [Bacillus cytotoxicus]